MPSVEHTYIVNVSVLNLRSGQIVYLEPDQWPDWLFDRQYVTPVRVAPGKQTFSEYAEAFERGIEPQVRDTSYDERVLGL